jgi:tRNA U34 2-thiouridine synthase MnmA/TrmU
VVVGFSGGVDSALTAFSLKHAGYDVLGVYMKNWDEKEEGFCNAEQEEKEARQVCWIWIFLCLFQGYLIIFLTHRCLNF